MKQTIISGLIAGLSASLLVACGSGNSSTSSESKLMATAAACYTAWNSTIAYNGGAQVSYNGVNYTAAFWTQGQNPSTNNGPAGSGQPWVNNGACGSTPTPTPAPTPSPTPTPSCTPTAITPYLQVNGGTWQQTSSATVTSGSSIKFGPQPSTGGSWSWTGCGTSGTSREQTITANGSCTATATYTNSCGARSSNGFNVTVSGTPTPTKNSFSSPFMGWSSWSVESSTRSGYGTNWLTESNVQNAANAMSAKIQAAGYKYINIDAGWNADMSWSGEFDGNGIPKPDATRFPNGISGIANYVHAKGLKLGLYYYVGLSTAVYNSNSPILGTSCHAQDIAKQPLTYVPNTWNNAWEINYSNSCAQAYINSIVNRFASWGVDLIKVDGTTADNTADVQAWSQAMANSGKSIWYTISAWPTPVSIAGQATSAGNSVRIDSDEECYCSTISSWTHSVSTRWTDLPKWLPYLHQNGWADLDSMPISNNTGSGIQDGINNDERQSVFNFWAMASAPLYIGGDIYFMDSQAQAIVTNPEIIAVDQSGVIPSQIASGNSQIWKKVINGVNYVAVYNLGSSPASITVNWNQLGLSGNASVRDLVSRTSLGTFNGSWTASNIPVHGSRLISLTQ